jgi:hypothetical protein
MIRLSVCGMSMRGVGAQGDPCTATLFLYTVRPDLLYSTMQSRTSKKVQYLTQRNLIIVTWFHKNVCLND